MIHSKTQIQKFLYSISIIASVLLIISISLPEFSAFPSSWSNGNQIFQFWVCIILLIDIFWLMFLSDKKWRFLLSNSVLIALSIPYVYLFNLFGLSLSAETNYVLSFLPILRGTVALIFLAKMVITNKITTLFVSYLTVFFTILYLQTLIFYIFELPKNLQIHTYSDAWWWAAMTVTTVGSNIIPVTGIGKVCTAILAVTGMTLFPIFTAYVTTLIHDLNKKNQS